MKIRSCRRINTIIIHDIPPSVFSLSEEDIINGDIIPSHGSFSKLLITFSQSLLLSLYIKICGNNKLGS